jgi:hypothetical protein
MQLALQQRHMFDQHRSEVSVAIHFQDSGKLVTVHTLLPSGQGEVGTKWALIRREA